MAMIIDSLKRKKSQDSPFKLARKNNQQLWLATRHKPAESKSSSPEYLLLGTVTFAMTQPFYLRTFLLQLASENTRNT